MKMEQRKNTAWSGDFSKFQSLHHLHINVDAGRKGEIRESLNDLRGRSNDIDDSLMHSHLELFSRIFEDKRRAVHRIFLDFRRKWDGANNLCVKAKCGIHDL